MKLQQIAVQIYTVRDHTQTPAALNDSLAKLKSIGFTAVELTAFEHTQHTDVARMLADNELACTSIHIDPQIIRESPEGVIETLETLGCNHAVYPYPADVDWSNKASIDSLIHDLDNAGRVLAKAGKSLAYHNHSLEFRKTNNQTVLDVIYDAVDAKYLQAEIDAYWIHHGGGENVVWCNKLAGRLPLLHVKDYVINDQDEPTFCEVGAGNLDFKRIIPAAEKAGCKWFVIEQDVCPGDPFDSLKQSYEYAVANLIDLPLA
ncbi:sugar phosphate isomerase/epimerase family protein [Poriferisphaera sp. WC338]|uniref:sugar phosphate isomerase/epimerase family protein n=1 Tax=Poriferisphaera sp. WC338 TaxID=3425129 RepID=UPI003D818CB2